MLDRLTPDSLTIIASYVAVIEFYTSHLDLGALLRLAAIAKPSVKPMARLSQHVPVVNVRHMPQYSNMMSTDFEWQKFTHCHGNSCPDQQSFCGVGLETCRIDCKFLPRLRSQRLQAPAIF